MKSRTRVAVIGGGIAGCSTLYHLVAEGWSDVVLIERDELTSGTTWHSAAQVTNFGTNQTMVGLKKHSIALYQKLRDDPDYPVGYHFGDGGIRLANTSEVIAGYRHFASMARGMGVDFEIIDAAECARRHPLINAENLLGGLWDPYDGDIDPAQLCQALAFHARRGGAEIYRQTAVTGLGQRADDSWIIETTKGQIEAEIIVNAGGYRVNEIGAMMEVHHPVASMEHQYFVTEDIAAIAHAGHRMPLIRDPIADFYCRQEKNGLLVGFYEQSPRAWGLEGIDPNFSNDLLPDDLDRIGEVLEGAMARLPVLAETGIRRIVNGPITYTIDGAPLVGPIPGKRNAFCIIGLRAGLGEGGGHGWLLAQMIVHGEAEFDTWALDPRRFGAYANDRVTALKAIEDYQNEFRFHFPHEYRPAARMARTTPLTPIFASCGAAFVPINGWERVDYFTPDRDFETGHGFSFDESFDIVAGEVATLQSGVGITEINGFTRIEITGAGREGFLERFVCGRVPSKEGRIGLAYLLNQQGRLKAEATLANLPASATGPARFWYGSAAAAERHDWDWLAQHVEPGEDVVLRPLTEAMTILLIAGPKSRALLAAIAPGDWSTATFPWLSVRETTIGFAPATVMAVSYSGELAFEIHVHNASLIAAYNALIAAGAPLGLRHFGARAIESMRLEKSFLHWKSEILTEYDPYETGLGRFVTPAKGDFIGRAALIGRAGQMRRKLVSLQIDSQIAPAPKGASLSAGGRVVGTITSGEWGHRTRMNLAMAFVDVEYGNPGTNLVLDLCGDGVGAQIIAPSPYDPQMRLLRG